MIRGDLMKKDLKIEKIETASFRIDSSKKDNQNGKKKRENQEGFSKHLDEETKKISVKNVDVVISEEGFEACLKMQSKKTMNDRNIKSEIESLKEKKVRLEHLKKYEDNMKFEHDPVKKLLKN